MIPVTRIYLLYLQTVLIIAARRHKPGGGGVNLDMQVLYGEAPPQVQINIPAMQV